MASVIVHISKRMPILRSKHFRFSPLWILTSRLAAPLLDLQKMITNAPPPSGDDFALFPFTSPVPQRNRRERKDTTTVATSREIRSPRRREFLQNRTHHTPLRLDRSTPSVMNEFSDTMTVPNVDTVKEQNVMFADFESMGFIDAARDEERWDAFGIQNCDEQTTPSPAELSRMSTKVQLGQAEVYDSAIEKLDCLKVVNVGALQDSVDDSVFGPSPLGERVSSPDFACPPDEVAGAPPAESNTSYVLMLATNMGMNRTQVQNQQRATMMLNALSIPFETIDGSDPSNKDLRNELFNLSDMRGVYPQFFVISEDDHGTPQTSFLGDWETIEGINDSSSLPAEILEANPTLLTWDRIHGLSFQK
jgi:hypothetical protein